jgi:hypothetical protein
MIASTSEQAYKSIKPKLGDKQRAVYSAIKDMGIASNEMLADYLHWPINCVTGRSTELHRYGMITVEKLGFSKSGRRTKMWSICDLNDSKLQKLESDCGA